MELYTEMDIPKHVCKPRRNLPLMTKKLSIRGGHLVILEKVEEINLAEKERHFFLRDKNSSNVD